MPDAASLYRALVVERARRPLHAGALELADRAACGTNPLCGDSVRVTLRLDPGGRAAEIRHHTRACAICSASADLMAEQALGGSRAEVQETFALFERLLRDGEPGLDGPAQRRLGPLLAFADLHGYTSRRKCAILPWSALLAALGSGEEP